MKAPLSIEEWEGGGRPREVWLLAKPDATRIQIVSKPFSVGAFAFAGLLLFAIGFLHGRYLRQLDGAAGQAGAGTAVPAAAPGIMPAASQAAAPAAATAAEPAAPNVVTVTIRLMKFSPEQIEIKPGDTVEWKNADLTPHTATASTKEFDSGSVNSNASWRQTFTKPGTFPYACTFHPEMKGTVVVK
ncbi:MAG: cupredoxin family copper-binding protein [Chthoniobacterales bacterium]